MRIRMPIRAGEHLTMKGLKVVLLTLSAVLLAASAVAQVSVYDTSDDLRRVPIPPVDRNEAAFVERLAEDRHVEKFALRDHPQV